MVKCASCNKKINVVEEQCCKCKCGNYYCRIHIFGYEYATLKNTNGHICSYDYKKTINEGTNGKCMDKKQDNPQMFKNFEKL